MSNLVRTYYGERSRSCLKVKIVTSKLTRLSGAEIDTFFAVFSDFPNSISFIFTYFVVLLKLQLLVRFEKISMYRS